MLVKVIVHYLKSLGWDSFDVTLAFYDDHFQFHRVSEKGTKGNKNNLMSFCLTIIIDYTKRIFDNLKVMFEEAYIVSVTS